MKKKDKTLRSIADIRRFFLENTRDLFLIGSITFDLFGIDDWVNNFRSISYFDCWDGRYPNSFTPSFLPDAPFERVPPAQWMQREVADYNNYLLRHPEVIACLRQHCSRPAALFLMFDEETEELCRQRNLEIWFPPARLRRRLDSKTETVRLAEQAGVPAVPNCLAEVKSWRQLAELAAAQGLGRDLVIQTAFGDSGRSTFFLAGEADWQRHADTIVGSGEVKIMRRINCASATQEACITKAGTVVAPLQTEVIGFPELTPERGGWSGNELFTEAFTPAIRHQAQQYTLKLGEQLRQLGYRGCFDVDYLIDRADGSLYLGEINPRISGATPLTTHSAFADEHVPLFLLHLLEFSGADFELDVDAVNAGWLTSARNECWSSLIVKHTQDTIEFVKKAPRPGIWSMDASGSARWNRFDCRCTGLKNSAEALVQRVAGEGTYRCKGGDTVMMILRNRVMTDDFQLNERAKQWIAGIMAEYQTEVMPAGFGDTCL